MASLGNEMRSLDGMWQKSVLRWKWRLLSVGIMIALAFALYVGFAASLEATRLEVVSQVEALVLPYHFMVLVPTGDRVLSPAELQSVTVENAMRRRESVFFAGEEALELTVDSLYGTLDLLGLLQGSHFYTEEQVNLDGALATEPGDIVLPQKFAQSAGLDIGDTLSVTALSAHPRQGSVHQKTFLVVGIYDGVDMQPALVAMADAEALSPAAERNRYIVSLASQTSTEMQYRAVLDMLHRVYPTASIISAEYPKSMGSGQRYGQQQANQSMLLLIMMFVCVGILTIAIITFMERRREFAVLKTLGLSNVQLTVLLGVEYSLAGLCGLLAGAALIAIASQWLPWLQALALLDIILLMLSASIGMALAVAMVLVYPLWMARAATVDHLLYARRIPLWVTRHVDIQKPDGDMALREQEENVRLMKLPAMEEYPDLLLMISAGKPVKAGEAVATRDSFFGLVVQEWIAPHDGIIGSIEKSGVVAIIPDDPNAPFSQFTAGMVQQAERRREHRLRAMEEARQINELGRERTDAEKALDAERRIDRGHQLQRTQTEVTSERRVALANQRQRNSNRAVLLSVVGVILLTYFMLDFGLRDIGSRAQMDRYETTVVRMTKVSDILSMKGYLSRSEQAILRAPSRHLAEVLVADGDVVQNGQALFRFEDPSVVANLVQADRALREAELALQSVLLLEGHAAAEIDLLILQQRAEVEKLQKMCDALIIFAPSSGRVVEVAASVNDLLTVGQTLMHYYDASLQDEDQARIALLQAENRFATAKQARDALLIRAPYSGVISHIAELGEVYPAGSTLVTLRSAEDVLTAAQSLALQKASLDMQQSQINSEASTISAPVSGWVSGLHVQPGDTVRAGETIAFVSDDRTMRVDLRVPQSQIGGIEIGNAVELRNVAGNRTYVGSVSQVAITGAGNSAEGVFFTVEAVVPNDGGLLVGMTLQGSIARTNQTAAYTTQVQGRVEYGAVHSIRAEVAGEVLHVPADEKPYVAAGDVLVQLENDALVVGLLQTERARERLLEHSVSSSQQGTMEHVFVLEGEQVTAHQVLAQLANSAVETVYLTAERDVLEYREGKGNREIRSLVSGKLVDLNIVEGMDIVEGQVLAVLEDNDLLYRLAKAETDLLKLEATRDAQAMNPLSGSQSSSTVKRDLAVLAYERAAEAVDNLILRAAVDGTVHLYSSLQAGDTLYANQLIAEVSSSTLKLAANVNEMQLRHIYEGLPLYVWLPAYPDELFVGTIDTIAHEPLEIAPNTLGVYYETTISLKQDERLMPGMSAEAAIELQRAEGLAIPKAWLRHTQQNGERVAVVDRLLGGHLVETVVEVGIEGGGMVHIISGLNENDTVVHLMQATGS